MHAMPAAPRPQELSNGLSIADVARETGIQKDTLRVWEKRYGFPVPGRDANGERTYDAEQVARLHLVRRLLDAGMRPGAVVPLSTVELQAGVQALTISLTEQASTRRSGRKASGELSTVLEDEPWLDWIRLGQTDQLQRALAQHMLRHGMLSTLDGLLVALGRAVGDAWFEGSIGIYQEHLYAEAVQRFLQDALRTFDRDFTRSARPPRVLLTTLPGEQHTLGLLMAECVMAMEGCQRFSLGRDTPLTDLVHAARELSLDVVAIGVSPHASGTSIWSALRTLEQELPPNVELWVGGNSRHLNRRTLPSRLRCLGTVSELSSEVARWRRQILPDTANA